MAISRTLIPPTSALAAFESAARHQSFTAAAAELNITQGAVSRQVRGLEDALGAQLFLRERQTVRLTAAGAAYAHEIRAALARISSATLGFRANPAGGTLNLAILPTFGTRWLAPRLPRFLAAHPGITINLATRLAPFDFAMDTVDAAIHFGTPGWAGAHLQFLMKESLVPACSPAFRREHRIRRPADLLRVPLIHLASRPDAWHKWLAGVGVAAAHPRGMLVDQFAVATQAAMADLGVALLPEFLVASELERGDLAAAVPNRVDSDEAYYLACAAARSGYPPLEAFRAWLAREAQR